MNKSFHAKNYIEAAKRTDGTSAPGNVIRSILHVGFELWKIVDEPADDLAVNYDHEGGVTMKERMDNILTMWRLK